MYYYSLSFVVLFVSLHWSFIFSSQVLNVLCTYFTDNYLEDTKLELVDVKDEPREIYMEGMEWSKENGPPPEGFTLIAMESGNVLRRKRQRNLQKIGKQHNKVNYNLVK